MRHAHHPLAPSVLGEARRSGAAVISLDVDELDDLRSSFDELEPLGGGSIDTALADALARLQRDGRTVLVLSNAAPQALSAADVAIGVKSDGVKPPWHADLIVDDLCGAWRVLHALPAARTASRRGVEISTAASLLGALLMVPGVRGRGPGPVTAGACGGLWTGYSLARRVFRTPPPPPAATHDWHAMSVEQVRDLLPTPSADPPRSAAGSRLSRTATTSVGVAGGMIVALRRSVGEFASTLREELSDPLTPVLATGSAASAVLGSPLDAVLVGSVLIFNSALAASQQVRAQRLLRRLLAVQEPPARTVLPGAVGERCYADTEAARLRPGDVIEVRPGEVIPADARLIEVADLEVDESTLTGESLPVTKQVDPTPGAALAERGCMLYAATTVVAGTGLALVTAIGPQTQVRRAAELPAPSAAPVGLQVQLRELTDRAWPASVAGGALVSALGLLRRTGLRDAIASGVAVTVAAVPEGLALVATLAQQASARRLTRGGALVRTPRAVEALGRVDVVCFDKTGTLSENRLRVTTVSAARGCARDDVLTCAARATLSPTTAARPRHRRGNHRRRGRISSRGDPQTGWRTCRSGRDDPSRPRCRDRISLSRAPRKSVLAACTSIDPEIRQTIRTMAANGLRVIAVARRTLTAPQAQPRARTPTRSPSCAVRAAHRRAARAVRHPPRRGGPAVGGADGAEHRRPVDHR